MRKDDVAWIVVGAMLGMALTSLAYDVFFGASSISEWLNRWGIGITAIAVLAGSAFGAWIGAKWNGKEMMASVAEDHRRKLERENERREMRAENLRVHLDFVFQARIDQMYSWIDAHEMYRSPASDIDLGPIFADWEALGLLSQEERFAIERANQFVAEALGRCDGNPNNFMRDFSQEFINGGREHAEACNQLPKRLENERLVIRKHRRNRQAIAELSGSGAISASGHKGN